MFFQRYTHQPFVARNKSALFHLHRSSLSGMSTANIFGKLSEGANKFAAAAKAEAAKASEEAKKFAADPKGGLDKVGEWSKAEAAKAVDSTQKFAATAGQNLSTAAETAQRTTMEATFQAQKKLEEHNIDSLKMDFGKASFDAAAVGNWAEVSRLAAETQDKMTKHTTKIEELDLKLASLKISGGGGSASPGDAPVATPTATATATATMEPTAVPIVATMQIATPVVPTAVPVAEPASVPVGVPVAVD